MNDLVTVAPASTEATKKEWRCFHCDEVFTDHAAAADHFGVQIDDCADNVACKLNATEGLIVKMLREAQQELRIYHQEDNAAFQQFYALGAQHSTALLREEEKGYARGLEDAKKFPETLGLMCIPPTNDIRDAARYRCLRAAKASDDVTVEIFGDKEVCHLSGDRLDEEVDKVISKAPKVSEERS
jgi:hypothetical protein